MGANFTEIIAFIVFITPLACFLCNIRVHCAAETRVLKYMGRCRLRTIFQIEKPSDNRGG